MSVPIVHGRRPRFRLPLAVAVLSLLLLPLAILSSAGDTANAQAEDTCAGKSVTNPEVEPISRTPAASTSYVVSFVTPCQIEPVAGRIVMELHEDIDVPRSISHSSVRVSYVSTEGSGSGTAARLIEPKDADDPNEPTTITIDPAIQAIQQGNTTIPANATVTVTLSKEAFIKNPTEGGDFSWKVGVENVGATGSTLVEARHPDPAVRDAFKTDSETGDVTGLLVDREIQLSHERVHRGLEVTVIGRGYKNETVLTFWRDANFNGVMDSGEESLCQANVGSNDIGTCSFTANKPPFVGRAGECNTVAVTDDKNNGRAAAPGANCNFINGVDGLNNTSTWVREETAGGVSFSLANLPQVLELEGYIIAEVTGSRRLSVQLHDFPKGNLNVLKLGGTCLEMSGVCLDGNYSDGESPPGIPQSGTLHFTVDLPGEVRRGYQTLQVVVTPGVGNGVSGVLDQEVQIIIWVDPDAVVTALPDRALPNQRVGLAGRGFLAEGSPDDHGIKSINLAGYSLELAGVNGGEGPAPIDRQGNWRGFVDLPINAATTTPGIKELRITDSEGRGGSVEITIPPREVEVAPLWSRPGSLVTVTGKGFPASNRNRSSVNVSVHYDTENAAVIVAAEPDANGEFSVELRIPLRAAAPSSNTIRVAFDGDDGSTVVTTAPHEIAGAAIAVNPAAGPPGTRITLTGEGFRKFAKVNKALIGEVDVAGGGTVTTDANGDFSLTFLAPGVGTGRQTVRATVAGVTASATFDLKPSGVVPGNTIPVAEALEPLGDRLLRVFHFNNDAKVWSFYDPAFTEDSNLDLMVAGETYLVMVSETTQAILNGKTRNLTCYQGNCWNQIIW